MGEIIGPDVFWLVLTNLILGASAGALIIIPAVTAIREIAARRRNAPPLQEEGGTVPQ